MILCDQCGKVIAPSKQAYPQPSQGEDWCLECAEEWNNLWYTAKAKAMKVAKRDVEHRFYLYLQKRKANESSSEASVDNS